MITERVADPAMERQAPAQADSLSDLVNRLTQELAHAQRSLAMAKEKLGTTNRALEVRTQALSEARSAMALLMSTLDATTDGMLAKGYFGRALHYNSRFVEMWRLPADKLDRLNEEAMLTMVLSQVKDPEAVLALMGQAQGQPDREHSGRVEMTDGRILDCRIIPQRINGRRVGTVTRFHEVTEREQLNRMVAVLEAQMPQEVAEARASAY